MANAAVRLFMTLGSEFAAATQRAGGYLSLVSCPDGICIGDQSARCHGRASVGFVDRTTLIHGLNGVTVMVWRT